MISRQGHFFGTALGPIAWRRLASGRCGAISLCWVRACTEGEGLRLTRSQASKCGSLTHLLPDCNFMFDYDAARAIGGERLEALAFIVREFFERGDLFLVSRKSGEAFP